MKMWKRILALVLILTVGMVSFEFPEFEGSVAKAEYIPFGTTDVPPTPDNLQSSGEWQYWLDGEYAIIAGYTNYAEGSLKIPAHINGHAVVGIGHNAFANNIGLLALTLHNNITRIADDAFGDNRGITIKCYNGSYSLWYAKKHGISVDNLSKSSKQVLAEAAIDMAGAPSRSYSNLSDAGVSVSTRETTFLQNGSVVFFPANENYPTGLAKKIYGIDKTRDTVYCSFSQPDFEEVFQEIHGSDVAYIDWDHAVYGDGISQDCIEAAASGGQFKRSINIGDLKIGNSEFSVGGKIDIEIGKMSVDYDLGVSWGLPYVKNLKVDLPVTVSPSVHVKYKHDYLKPKNGSGRLVKRINFLKNAPVASIGGVINGYCAVDLVFSVEGEFEISVSAETVYTFTLKNGKADYYKSQKTSYGTTKVKAAAKFGPEFKLYFVLGWAGFSIRFFETSVGGFVKLEGNIKWESGLTGHVQGITHGEISLKLQFEVSFKIGIIEVLGIKGVYYNKTFEFPIPLFTFHNDDGDWVKECVLKGRTVIFCDYDRQYEKNFDVGKHIIEPMSRARSGFRFDGWYLDSKSTGWGNNQKWNFSSMPMPYINNGGAVYLQAKWTPVGVGVTPDPVTAPPTYRGRDNSISTGGGSGSTYYYITPAPTPSPTPTPTPPPVPVTGITLNKTSAEFYKGDNPGTVQLTASVAPANATSKDVLWESSNDSIATVDQSGLVKIGNSGTAVITCRSAASPEITAKCTIKVKQKVEEVFVETSGSAVAPGETIQLTASCYPTNAENKSVKWTSGDVSIATVDNSGLVTAKKVGSVTISAAAQDGSGIVGTYELTVEPELALDAAMINDTLYLEGEDSAALAYVTATNGSVRRMLEKGYQLEWSVISDNQYLTAVVETMENSVEDKGKTYDTSLALVSCSQIKMAGKQSITVRCDAGPYSATKDISVDVFASSYAQEVKLTNSTIYTDVDTDVLLPNPPVSKDGKPVPSDLSMEIEGDRFWWRFASEAETSDGILVSFSESGIYEGTVYYRKANLVYAVSVTFYVRDEDGTVHLRVEDITLSDAFVDMVEGQTRQLTAAISPVDAYNKDVIWKSEDESIATVSQSGIITALRAGSTSVYCEAQDGSECFSSCAVRVESFLNLDEDVIDVTVYTSGRQQADIETVNVTFDSEKRLQDAGLNVTWELQKLSGTVTELAVEEYQSIGEDGITVSGNRIKLLRINGVGVDEYLLKCSAGHYSDECVIRLSVIEDALPTVVSLNKTAYQGMVGQVIVIDTTPVCIPNDSTLPDDVSIEIDGTKAFRNALSDEYSFLEPESLIFEKAGLYNAQVVFSGGNYEYTCPITIEVSETDGSIPDIIQDVTIQPEELTLLVGESYALSGKVLPETAAYSKMNWSSYDTSVATVSANGIVTAIDTGITGITLSIPETDLEATCLVVVEDGMTMRSGSLERTVFVDGITRMELDTVMLTEASSKRLEHAPEWKLERVSGNNLTLRVSDYETVNEEGDMIYGSKITLHSVSRPGDAVYNLIATAGNDSATAQITIHAVNRDNVLPASLDLAQTEYEAGVGELIVMKPEVVCWPEDTALPNGIRVSIEGDKQFTDAVNGSDYYVSQSVSTLSFSEPGRFDAEYVYNYSNVRYTIPIRFRIHDAGGDVPILAKKLQLYPRNTSLTVGETLKLDAVFTPADTSEQAVSWSSSDPSVATVTTGGLVKAIKNGQCIITCTPADSHSDAAQCAVTVEDYFTVDTGETLMSLYLQGSEINDLSSAWLSEGTAARLEKEGLNPEWSLVKDNVTHAEIAAQAKEGENRIDVVTTELVSGGTDTYTLRCEAGDHVWSKSYTLQVRDLGTTAPGSISLVADTVNASVGQMVKIDFTPVLAPTTARLPEGISSYYVGIGDFYEAMDAGTYSENGNEVTVAFTRPGRYVMSRQYLLGNLHYTTACTVNVGVSESGSAYNLLDATETEYTVYSGGKSGVVSTISIKDGMVAQEWGDSLVWNAERISGNSVTTAIKSRGDEADLYVADVVQNGTDTWRVSCTFGGITDSIDIQLTSVTPRLALPESISIQNDHLSGTIGNWITVPLGVSCNPAGSALPDTGDAFWHLSMDGYGDDVADYEVKNNRLYINFSESGYYMSKMTYQAGNISYTIPLYFTIEDEEGVVSQPALNMYVLDMADTVYPEGDTGISIGKAVMSESLSTYKTGAAVAYMEKQDAVWSIKIDSGTAAQLSLLKETSNVYDIMLVGIKGSGNVTYTVKCLMNGQSFTRSGTLHIAGNGESRPDATLLHTSYTAPVNTQISIDRRLYSRNDGSILQGNTCWNADGLLSAMGYDYQETDTQWNATFYKTGVYTSEVTGYVGNLLLTLPVTITITDQGQRPEMNVLLLPGALTTIDDEAFIGTKADVVDLRGTRITVIGASAFKNCVDLKIAYLPSSVTFIGANAFYGCLNVTIYCEKGSYAENYARNNHLPFVYMN